MYQTLCILTARHADFGVGLLNHFLESKQQGTLMTTVSETT